MERHTPKIPQFLFFVLTLPLFPIAAVLCLILWIFRTSVALYLKLKLGDDFGGLVSSADKIYLPKNEKSRKIILTLSYIKSDKKFDVMKTMSPMLKNSVFSDYKAYPKLTSTYRKFLGHYYLLNNQVSFEDIVKYMPMPTENVEFDEEYLKKFMGKMANSPLPKNETALWEVLVSKEPIVNMHSSIKGYVYPMLMRFHHAVADGARVINFQTHIASAKFENNYCDKLKFDKGIKRGIFQQIISLVEFIIYILYTVALSPMTLIELLFLREDDDNRLHVPSLSGEKIMAWTTNYEVEHVTMVREIKNRIPYTRFTDVVFACISASIHDFCKKKQWPIPEKISCLIPIFFVDPNSAGSQTLNLRNNFTFCVLDMPIINPSRFLNGLEKLKIGMDNVKKNKIPDVFYWSMNYLSAVIPDTITDLMTGAKSLTCAMSSLPGTSKMKVYGEYDLLANFSSGPHTNALGVTFTVFSYDNRLHLCLLVDKAVISEQEDAQYIVDRVLKNIELLNKESLKVYN